MKQPPDHHPVPRFLLDHWCKPNGKLIVYTRSQRLVLAAELRPGSVAAEPDRNAYPGLPSGRQSPLDVEMANRAEASAASIVRRLVDGEGDSLSTEERMELTWFVLSLRPRYPSAGSLTRRILNAEPRRDPEAYVGAETLSPSSALIEWDEPKTRDLLPETSDTLGSIIDDALGARIFDSPWYTYDARHASTDFVIGDRPCLLGGNSVLDDITLALPLSPRVMFVICSRPARIEFLKRARVNDVVSLFNRASVIYARERVYSTGKHHLPLVARFFRATPAHQAAK